MLVGARTREGQGVTRDAQDGAETADTPLIVFDARGNGDGKIVPTITVDHNGHISDYTAVVCVPVYCLQGNGIDRADTAGCNGKGWCENACYTLNTIDRPAVVYSLDRAFFNQGENAQYKPQISEDGICQTLVAKGPSAVCFNRNELPPPKYIVRRLTPTECARLQGFADKYSYIDNKTELTDEEYEFWLNVRNTHAEINGKTVKDYSKLQMLNWYNKLHTDSAEYKMWGNGIALPPALYVMEGVAEVLNERRS